MMKSFICLLRLFHGFDALPLIKLRILLPQQMSIFIGLI